MMHIIRHYFFKIRVYANPIPACYTSLTPYQSKPRPKLFIFVSDYISNIISKAMKYLVKLYGRLEITKKLQIYIFFTKI